MSAIWGWAHEAEHPEKCIRITSSVAGRRGARRSPSVCGRQPGVAAARAHFTARSLVSTTANRQNSLPVQATTPRVNGPGNGE